MLCSGVFCLDLFAPVSVKILYMSDELSSLWLYGAWFLINEYAYCLVVFVCQRRPVPRMVSGGDQHLLLQLCLLLRVQRPKGPELWQECPAVPGQGLTAGLPVRWVAAQTLVTLISLLRTAGCYLAQKV